MLFLSPARKKKIPKGKEPAALPGLLRTILGLKDRNSLRSDSQSFYTPENRPPLHAPTVRPDCLRTGTAFHKYRCWLC